MLSRTELERIYDEHASCVFALFRRFSTNDAETRDLLQDWLIKIAAEKRGISEIRNERAYFLKIAYRQAVDWKRKRNTRRRYTKLAGEEVAHTFFASEPDPDREFVRESIEESLARLPEEQQLVIQLKLLDDLTFVEIATILNISQNTAASRYRYGIEKMQDHLRPVYEEITTGGTP